MASTELTPIGQTDDTLDHSDVNCALAGELRVHVASDRYLVDELADVWMPVMDSSQHAMGFVRVTYQLPGVYAQFICLRYFIVLILLLSLVLGTAIGWALALNLERPLRHVAESISRLSPGDSHKLQLKPGPEEINLLVIAFNDQVEKLDRLEHARLHLLASLIHELARPISAFQLAVEALSKEGSQDAEVRRQLLSGISAKALRLACSG